MKCLIIFLPLVITVSAEEVHRFKRAPIVNGNPTRINHFPYFASIVHYNPTISKWWPICGASILAEHWLLSASHCFKNNHITGVKIRTGYDLYHNNYTDVQLYNIKLVHFHPNYTRKYFVILNDICLIELTDSIAFQKYVRQPILLPDPACVPKPGNELTIMGFGLQETQLHHVTNKFPTQLLYGKVKVISRKSCIKKYSKLLRLTKELICATSKNNEIGKNDSGGPAVRHSYIVGIISTASMESKKEPGIYTNVHRYVHWIQKVTGITAVGPIDQYCCLKTGCAK